MFSVIYGIVHAADTGWGNAATIALLVAGLGLLGLFVLGERQAKQPILPLRLFASPKRTASYVSRTLYIGVIIGFWFFASQYLHIVKGFSRILAGFAFLPMTLANFWSALYIPRLVRRIGNSRLISTVFTITIVGMLLLSRITPQSSYLWHFALPLLLLGVGLGLSQGPITTEGLAGVDAKDVGAASGITYVAMQLGATLGLAILIAVFSGANAPSLSGNALLTHRITMAFVAASILLVLSLASLTSRAADTRQCEESTRG